MYNIIVTLRTQGLIIEATSSATDEEIETVANNFAIEIANNYNDKNYSYHYEKM